MKNSPGPFFFMTVLKILEHVRDVVVDGMAVTADRMVGPTGAAASCLGVAFFLLRFIVLHLLKDDCELEESFFEIFRVHRLLHEQVLFVGNLRV